MKAILPLVAGDTTNAPPKHRWLLGLALALAVCASGCVIIPTPEFNSGRSRANINKETPRQFELGKTTRADMISVLGEPDAVSPDELMLAYRSEKIRAYWIVGSQAGAVDGFIYKDLYLVAEFDAHGVLQKLEPSSHWLVPADPNKMLPAATATNVKAIRLQKPASWLPGVDGYKSYRRFWAYVTGTGILDEKRVPGQLLLTDTELQFVAKDQFANTTDPELILPFDAVTEVSVDEFGRSGRLVVRTRTGEVNSFEILKGIIINWGALWGASLDREASQSVAELLQSKIKH
jgi:hypothetical protein